MNFSVDGGALFSRLSRLASRLPRFTACRAFPRKASLTAVAAGALALSSIAAQAHTVSYGYVASTQPGVYTFWFGTYHNTTNFTEGSLKLTCGGGFSSTLAFNTLVTARPAGLVAGSNYFYDAGYGGEAGSPLFASTPTHSAGTLTGPVARWQGVTFTNITYPGTCNFTYIPVASPTQDWNPNGNNGTLVGINGGSFVLTEGMTIAKTSTVTSFASVGASIPYSYKITNTGSMVLTAPLTVTDNKTPVTCPAFSALAGTSPVVNGLATGASITCTGNYVVNQADIDAGFVTNSAFAKSGTSTTPYTSPTVNLTVNAAQNRALTVVKSTTATNFSTVGASLSYSFKVTNSGNTTLTTAITVSDNKIASITCPALTGGVLAPGASITCTGTYLTKQADLDAGSVVNTATASSGVTTSPTVSASVPAVQSPAIGVVKSSTSVNYSAVGQSIAYSYAVTNNGNTTLASPITVSDSRIASVSCPAGSLAPGLSTTCTANYVVTQADIDAGSLTNTASAKSGATTSSLVSKTVPAVQSPAITTVKTTTTTAYTTVGQSIPYIYKVTNSGNVTLTSAITATDNKIASVSCPALPAGGLAPGASINCSGGYLVTQADIDAGFVTNTASAKTGATTSPTVSATVNATKSPSLSISKSTTSTNYSALGQVIPYSYTVTNNGNTTLTTALSVSDSKIASISCPALPVGGLSPGAAQTCTGNYTVTQVDIDAGSVVNTASASSGQNRTLVEDRQHQLFQRLYGGPEIKG